MALIDNQGGPDQFRISFDLDDIAKVSAWGKPDELNLHWYGLTSGRYWIETQSGSPLEYTTEIQEYWSCGKHAEYYVARLFEDLLSLFPAILEPVPTDIAARTANPSWIDKAELWRAEDEETRWDQWYSATKWWHARSLDLGYLTHRPWLHFWRVGRTVFLRWKADGTQDGIAVWAVPAGEVAIDVTVFESSVVQFCEEFLATMGRRVRSIEREGWTRTDCTLDIDYLTQEHATRHAFFETKIQEKHVTGWTNLRASLDVLLARMGETMTPGA